MGTVLELKNITKRYHGVTALHNVSVSFGEGEIHAVMGENGAGKSTLIKAIAGAIPFDAGSFRINGREYTRISPHEAIENGIGVIYQEFCLVPSLSIAENIFLGKKTGGNIMPNFEEMNRLSVKIFEDFNIKMDTKRMVSTLSTAQQQIVEIAKAILRNVKVLIMDEPSATLAISEVEKMFDLMKSLKKQGVTVIYVSHRIDEVFEICDKVTVLRDGEYVGTKDISDIDRKTLVNMMVGRDLDENCPTRNIKIGQVVLEARNVSGNGVKNIDLSLHKGEVLGMSGLVGSGRTEFAKVLYGAAKMESGQIFINGTKVSIRTPGEAISIGIGLIPEDRKTEGVLLEYSIEWNISLMCLKRLSKRTVVLKEKVKETVHKYYELMNIKAPSTDTLVKKLSGGNQQKVVLAKTLAANTKIIIFDEPTRGIDVGAKQEIYKLMNTLVEAGNSIIMISSDMEELLGMSDRIVVLHEGRVSGELKKSEFSQSSVLSLASALQGV